MQRSSGLKSSGPGLIALRDVQILQPPVVRPAHAAARQRRDHVPGGVGAHPRQFLAGQILEPPAGERVGPFQRRHVFVRVGEDTLKIRIAPWREWRLVSKGRGRCRCTWRSRRSCLREPRLCCGRIGVRGAALRRHRQPHERDENGRNAQQQQRARAHIQQPLAPPPVASATRGLYGVHRTRVEAHSTGHSPGRRHAGTST